MSTITPELARKIFDAACDDGTCEAPAALKRVLADVAGSAAAALTPEELENLGHAVSQEFSTLGQSAEVDSSLETTASARREAAVRAVMNGLRDWTAKKPHALNELTALLTTINALDLNSAGLRSVATKLASDDLMAGLIELVDNAHIGPWGGTDVSFPGVQQDLKTAVEEGNYERLYYLTAHLMPEFRAEIWAAVVLLWRCAPAELAKATDRKNDVFFSMFVRLVLKDDITEFALQVPLVSFKFMCVDSLEEAHRSGRTTHDWSELLRKLLLQVAETAEWSKWMQALLKSPAEGSLITLTIPEVLADLEEHHWAAFINALSLGYSKRAAKPVSSIMAVFSQKAGPAKSNAMWTICFRRWVKWNYGKNEEQFYLFAPAVCALDYPVAKHYSTMLGAERDGEESALSLAVERIEQQWFSSATDLITERNRLLSRLRLVTHGRELAVGSADLLPPAVQPPSDPYTRIRYGYHDVQFG